MTRIKVPFQLLQVGSKFVNDKNFLNKYYFNIISCMKEAERVAVAEERVKFNTWKPELSWDLGLKSVKNKAKFWLRIWVSCERPRKSITSIYGLQNLKFANSRQVI